MAVQWDVLFFWSARRSGVLFRCFFAHEIESRQSDPSVTFDTFQALSGWLKPTMPIGQMKRQWTNLCMEDGSVLVHSRAGTLDLKERRINTVLSPPPLPA